MPRISATAPVPPSASMISESVYVFMLPSLGAPKFNVKAQLNDFELVLPNMNTWNDRLRELVAEFNLNKSELADIIGVSPPTVTEWLNGSTGYLKAVNADRICRHFKVNMAWFLEGKGPKWLGALQTAAIESNVVEAPRKLGKVPLISWIRAGTMTDIVDLYEPGDAEAWYSSHASHSQHSFALRVDGDSMTSPIPGVQSFPHGCVLIVDPERPVYNGAKVVAKHIPSARATFKVFQDDGLRKLLVPLNPVHLPAVEMDHNYQIIGVVIEKIEAV